MKKILFLFVTAGLILSCSSINKQLGLKDDNFYEQIIEFIFNEEFGTDIDLTPDAETTP